MITKEKCNEIREKINGIYHISDEKTAPAFTFCLDLTFYYEGGLKENGKGILGFYDKALEYIEDKAKYYLIDDEGRFKKVRKGDLEKLPDWIKKIHTGEDKDRGIYGLCLETGDVAAGFTDLAYQTMNIEESSGYSRLVLPAEFIIEQGIDAFIELAIELSSQLNFSSGLAGFAANKSWNSECSNEHFLTGEYFPGISLADPDYFKSVIPRFSEAFKPSIAGVNWLTFLDKSFVKRIGFFGGVKKLRKQLSSEIKIHELANGIMIQAGPVPVVGDETDTEYISLYAEVYKALKLFRPSEEMWGPDGIYNHDFLYPWSKRFE